MKVVAGGKPLKTDLRRGEAPGEQMTSAPGKGDSRHLSRKERFEALLMLVEDARKEPASPPAGRPAKKPPR